jgi:protein gp37
MASTVSQRGTSGSRAAGDVSNIVGGESGPVHRPMEPAWIEELLRGCREQGAALLVKQDSGREPGQQGQIPEMLWIREFPR